MEAIIDVLPVTTGRVLRVWWAYFWRSIVALMAMFVVILLSSIAFGVIFSLAMPLLGLGMDTAHGLSQLMGTLFGLLAGVLASIIPLWLILGKDFGEFRLALITYQPVTPDENRNSPEPPA